MPKAKASTPAPDVPTMQIHHLETGWQERWVTDPALGLVKRREQVVKASTTHCLTHEGVAYHRGDDGTFDVPVELGEFLTSRPATGWNTGPNPFFTEEQPEPSGSRTKA